MQTTATTLLKELLKFKSLTPNDDGALNYIATILQDFEAIFIEKNGVKNLLLTKKFAQKGEHLAFAGHIDVVPAGDGWESEPFAPLEKGGFIYGRGAADMKSGLAAFIAAAQNADFKGSRLSLIITSDEEGEAKFGTLEVLKYMRQNALLPHFAVVAEPTCEGIFGDTIKIGRRGSINAKLVIKGVSGHAAYPEKCQNPVHLFAPSLSKLAGYEFDNGNEHFAPSKLVITDIRGGSQVCNVTPSELCIMFNVRNSPSTSVEMVQEFVQSLCDGLEFTLDIKQSSKPFLTNKNSKIAEKLAASVAKIARVQPEFNTKGGTSDARFLAEFGVNVVEFGVRNESIHAVNERVSVAEVEFLSEIFGDLLRNF